MNSPFDLDSDNALRYSSTGQPSSHPLISRRPKKKKTLSDAAAEMVSIRKQLGFTQDEFAVALGEPKDRVVNIENGRVKTIDPKLLDAARQLLSVDSETRVRPLRELERMTMTEIIARWWEMVGAKDDAEGSILLGLSLVTVGRWRTGQFRPEPGDLLKYELVAKRIMNKMQTPGAASEHS